MFFTSAPFRPVVAAVACILGFCVGANAWQSDNGNGTFSNPVLYADYPDPDIIRVTNDFYMVSTTFADSPGINVLHSKDLVNWEIMSHCATNLDWSGRYNMTNGVTAYREGFWAGSIRFYNGQFYVLANPVGANARIYYATNAAGPWQYYQLNQGAYDASLFIETNGAGYIVEGHGPQNVLTLNANFSSVVAISNNVVNSGGEGSHLVKKGSYYYLFNANPGIWPFQLLCSRSTNIFGPWETGHVCLTATTGGHQGAIVDLDNTGTNWFGFVHQDSGAVGRMTRVGPVFWSGNWPVFGTTSASNQMATTYTKPVLGQPIMQPATSDDFSSSTLGLQWQWNHNPDNTRWSLTQHSGHLRLRPTQASQFWTARNTLAQKAQGPQSQGIVKFDISNLQNGDFAGFGTLGSVNGYIYVTSDAGGNKTLGMVVDDRSTNLAVYASNVPFSGTNLYLRTDLDFTSNMGTCSYSTNGIVWSRLGGDFALKFDIVTGTFQGEKYALFCYNPNTASSAGYVDVDYFQFNPSFTPLSMQRGRAHLNAARTTFVADNGQPLRGPYTSTEWTTGADNASIASMKNLGFNAIHLYAETFDPNYPNVGSTAPGYASNNVDRIVAATRTNGLYLIITIGNGANNGNNNYQWATNFWKFYAPRYANETHVLYEIHNEPVAWGPPYLTATTPAGAMNTEVDCYKTIRANAPNTPVLLFTYAVLSGSGGTTAAMTDITNFNQRVFGNVNAVWTNEVVGFHGYGGWQGTSQAVAGLLASNYPCMMTEFGGVDWGGGGGLDVELTSELERLGVSWLSFQYVPPSGVSDIVTDPTHYQDLVDNAGLSWVPDYGYWPVARGPYGNGGQPRSTTTNWVSNFLTGTNRIQAEDFDAGGEGVAYHDNDSANNGGQYRSGEGVDIETTLDSGGGYDIGWTSSGEWLEYSVWIQEPGYYNLSLRFAGIAASSVNVVMNDRDKTGTWALPSTGGWQTWATATTNVFLEFGRQKLRLNIVSGAPNLNWIELSPSTNAPIPNGIYKLVNRGNGQAMTYDMSIDNVVQTPYAGMTTQQWTLQHLGAGQYKISSAFNSDNWTGGGLQDEKIGLVWWWSTDANWQRAVVRPTGDGFYRIAMASFGLELEPQDGATTNGAFIVPTGNNTGYTGLPQQQWGILTTNAPAPPTGLNATMVSASQINVSWNGVVGATGYNVKRATVAGGPYATIASGATGTNYSDTAVNTGTTYYYVVTAVVGAAESLPSNEDSATPLGIQPGVPSPFAADLYNINIAGTEADPGLVANGTLIAAPSPSPGSDRWNNLTCVNWWDFTGPRTLTNASGSNTISMNWSGESGHCLIRWNSGNYYGIFKAMFGEPAAQWDLTTTFSGLNTNASYDVYWYSTWPESENPLTNTVTVGTCAVPTKVMYPEQDNVAGASDYSGLAEDVNYSILTDITPNASGVITVRSRGFNVSVAGIQVVKRPPPVALPATPIALNATAVATNQINLLWNISTNAASYNVKRSTTNGGPYTVIATGVTATNYSDIGLAPATTYYYVASAVNLGGESTNSPQASAITLAALSSVAVYNVNFAGCNWGNVTNPIYPVSNGRVMMAPATGGSERWNNYSVSAAWENPSPVTLVAANEANTNTVTLQWGGGSTWTDGPTGWSGYNFSPLTNTVWPAYMGDSGNAAVWFSGLDTNVTYDVYVYFTWDRNGDPMSYNLVQGTAAVTNLLLDPDPAFVFNSKGTNYVNGTNYVVFNGVMPKAGGTIMITNGNYSALQLVKRSAVAPAGLAAAAVAANQINLTWNLSTNAASYNVKRSPTDGGPYTVIASGVTATNYSDTGLASATTYYYVVSAVNAGGESANSAQASATTQPAVLPQPHIVNTMIVGGNLVFSGTNGLPNGTYAVLSTTNVALPLTNWVQISAGTFDANGNFAVTNSVNPSALQQFYQMRQP